MKISMRMPKEESWTLSAWQLKALKLITADGGDPALLEEFSGRTITGLVKRMLIVEDEGNYRITAAGQRILTLRKEGNRILRPEENV